MMKEWVEERRRGNGVVRRSDTIDVVLIEGAEEEERNGVVVRRRVAVDVVLIEGLRRRRVMSQLRLRI